ncbi:MAG TPA: hypothetical protein PKH69_02230 [Thiobacillaceae bacterium]|nr:hypothetical protein [Thiobacillaceae bacterium]HNU62904.1 hypothetical protein [Thiobacillaceae bacterium]
MASPGLSYDQAPPLGTPLRLFLAAPVFLILAAMLAMVSVDDWLAGRWTPQALALTHLLTLGYLGMVMTGAVLQILPVVVGSPVPAARLIGWLALGGLGSGALLLSLGFLGSNPVLLGLAALALTVGLVPFLLGTLASLARARALPHVAWPMRQAWMALVVTFILGLALAANRAGLWHLSDPMELTDLHAAWGLGGWILILVIGVAYQVVPMLQLTPPYPRGLIASLTWAMPVALLLLGLAWFVPRGARPGMEVSGLLIGMASALAFALATLGLQHQRRRKLADVTLDFWRLGMSSLIAAALLVPLLVLETHAGRDRLQLLLGLLFLLGFAASAVNGMLYKIVPFLGWFHLQSQTRAGAGKIPNMRQFVADAKARWHFRLHLAAVLLLLPTPWLHAPLALPGLGLLAASAMLLGRNLHQARAIFLAHTGRL